YWLDFGLPVALGILAIGLRLGLPLDILEARFTQLHHALPGWVPPRLASLANLSSTGVEVVFVFALPVMLCYLFVKRPLRFGLGVGALLLVGSLRDLVDEDIKMRGRSFFGALHVEEIGRFRRLMHGTTLHGQQRIRWTRAELSANATMLLAATDSLAATSLLVAWQDNLVHPGREPLTYFHRTGPIGQIFTAYQDQLAGRPIGLIGLGSGTLANYGQPGQTLTYYEIDPLVRSVAYDSRYFSNLKDARE